MNHNGLRLDVQRDWNWSDGFLPEVRRILMQNAALLFNVRIASSYQDVKQATDMLLTVSGQRTVAVRLRRAQYSYRDLTIRASRVSGTRTELDKIRSGYGDIYLYGWTYGWTIHEWMLVNLHRLRSSNLLNSHWPMQMNRDGATGFISIPYLRLYEYGCIEAANVRAA